MSEQKKYTIYTLEDWSGSAPMDMRWAASFSPLDEGEPTINGYGATEDAAITDLVTQNDLVPA